MTYPDVLMCIEKRNSDTVRFRANEIGVPGSPHACPQFHSVRMVIKCNHILISLYKLKSEAEIACKFQDAVGRRFQRLDILL